MCKKRREDDKRREKEELKKLARYFAKKIKPCISNKEMLPEVFRAFVEVSKMFDDYKKIKLI